MWRSTPAVPGAMSAPGLLVYHFGSDLFYANVGRFESEVRSLVENAPTPVRWLLIDAGPITSVDYTAARSLRALLEHLRRRNVTLALVHVEAYMRADLDRHRLTDVIGADLIFDRLREALVSLRGA